MAVYLDQMYRFIQVSKDTALYFYWLVKLQSKNINIVTQNITKRRIGRYLLNDRTNEFFGLSIVCIPRKLEFLHHLLFK